MTDIFVTLIVRWTFLARSSKKFGKSSNFGTSVVPRENSQS